MADACEAADSANWSLFIVLMDGCQAKRKDHPVKLAKSWNDKPGKYSEPIGWEIMGLEANEYFLITRIHHWTSSFKSASNDEYYLDEDESAKKSTGGTRRGSEAV